MAHRANERAKVPIISDVGVGTASDANIAMERGCAGVPMNSTIAHAHDSVLLAHAMKLVSQAGRAAFHAGRMPRKRPVSASPSTAASINRCLGL